MTVVKILGLIKAIHVSATAPTNTTMLWFDTNVNIHKYYDTVGSSWVTLAAGGSSWATSLLVSPSTGPTNPVIDSGQGIEFINGGFKSTLEASTLTADWILQLPNKSGIIATMGDIGAALGLNGVLTASPLTGGVNIQLSDGDTLKAENGSGLLNLRNGVDGTAVLSGINVSINASGQALLFGSTASITTSTGTVYINGKTGIQLVVNGAEKARLTTVGLGIGISNPDSQLQSHLSTAPVQTVAGIKLTGGADFTMGSDPAYGWMQTWSSWMALNPLGESVGIGTGTVDPQVTSSNVILMVAGTNAELVIRKDAAANTSSLDFYEANVLSHQLGTDATSKMYLQNLILNKDIDFIVNVATTPTTAMTILGSDGSVHANEDFHADKTLNVNENIIVKKSNIILSGTSMDVTGTSSVRIVCIVDNTIDNFTGDLVDGKILYLTSISLITCTLTHLAGGSGDIHLESGADRPLTQGETITLIYDSGGEQWNEQK